MKLTTYQLDKWEDELRNGGHTQCRGQWKNQITGSRCCLTILGEEVLGVTYSPAMVDAVKDSLIATFSDKLGWLNRFMKLNDTDYRSFTEIADKLKEWRLALNI